MTVFNRSVPPGAIVLLIGVWLVTVPLFPLYLRFTDTPTDIEWIEDVLDVSLENVEVEGYEIRRRYAPFIKLRFRAQADEAFRFGHAICPELIPGYDPFAATDSPIPSPGSHLIRDTTLLHYSNSPDTSDAVLGARCHENGYLRQITLDTSTPDDVQVRIEMPHECFGGSFCFPETQGIHPFATDELPLFVTGIEEDQHGYVQVYPTMCLDTWIRGAFVMSWETFVEDAKPFWGASLSIHIDDALQPPAHIAEDRWDLRRSDIADESHRIWDYCITPDLSPGTHTLRVVLKRMDGELSVLSFRFRSE